MITSGERRVNVPQVWRVSVGNLLVVAVENNAFRSVMISVQLVFLRGRAVYTYRAHLALIICTKHGFIISIQHYIDDIWAYV